MAKIETPWGDFEKTEDTQDIVEKEVLIEEEPDSKEVEEKEEEEPQLKEIVEEVPEDIIKTFDSITSSLEEEDLLFISEDKEYAPTAEGFKELVKDNLEALKTKLESEYNDKIKQLKEELESKDVVSVGDLDPSVEEEAVAMLERYYEETGFTEDEIVEKLEEVKNLDTIEKEAKIAQRFLVKQEKELNAIAEQNKTKEEEKNKKKVEDYIASIKTQIDETEEIAGFKLSQTIKNGFKEYLFKHEKDGLTKAQKAANDSSRRLKLAFLDYMDYNKKDFEVKIKTELANEYEKKKSRFTSKQSSTKGVTINNGEERQDKLLKGFADFWKGNSEDND